MSLSRAGFNLVELNEAFAAQTLGIMRRLGLHHEVTQCERRGRRLRPSYGLATLCVGVGKGFVTLVEWLD